MYRELIKQAIEEKNITQEKIVEECEKTFGIKISRTTISKILHKGVIPDDEVSKMLAKVLDIDEELLILDGYLEKAPMFFKEYIEEFTYAFMSTLLLIYENIEDFPKDYKRKLKKLVTEYKSIEILLEILRYDNYDEIYNYISNLNSVFYDKNILINNSNRNEISIKIKDNSMEPLIPKESSVRLVKQEEYQNGDIVVIQINKIKKIRVIVFNSEGIILYPYNTLYKTELIENGKYKIIGKVSSYTKKL